MNIWSEALAQEEYVISCRRYMHENPELSDQEDGTVAFILEQLRSFDVECYDVPQGGVMGFIEGSKPGKTVLLRADIDALPIQEDTMNNKQPKVCVSKVPGVSHACGHDTHAAMLLGAARILQSHRQEFAGRIVLYFERGEEHGHGDYYMPKYLQDNHIHIDGCWAMHNRVSLPTGTIALTPGGVYAGNAGFSVKILGENALACGVAVVNGLNALRTNTVTPFEHVTLSCNSFQYENGVCSIWGTCRYYDFNKVGVPMREAMQRIITETVAAYGCTTEKPLVRIGGSRGAINDATCYEIAKSAVTKALGAECIRRTEPSMGAESFSVLATYYPSFYAALGAGNPEKGMDANGHTPKHEPDEAAFKTGVAATVAYALEFLAYDQPIPFEPFVGTIDEYLEANRR